EFDDGRGGLAGGPAERHVGGGFDLTADGGQRDARTPGGYGPDARERADDLVAGDDVGRDRGRHAGVEAHPAQEAVDVAAGVDAAHELLAEEAALGERDGVELEERLLRDGRVVDVDAEARHAVLDARRL